MKKSDFPKDFGPFNGKIWLNCSHQRAMPRVAVSSPIHVATHDGSPPRALGQLHMRSKKAQWKRFTATRVGTTSKGK